MAVSAKICGVNSAAAAAAAVDGGAAFVGFIFFPRSPRHLDPAAAADLARRVPGRVGRVGVFVDPTDAELAAVANVPLSMLQLHGAEDPARVAHIRARTGLKVMKAIAIADAADLKQAAAFAPVADWLLFDAKPPKSMASALPGGNALAFDWEIMRGHHSALPWMLSGGLSVENVAEAVRVTGAAAVDVSSGVEDAPGKKNPDRIRAFLDATARL
ncbi:MAG: phosphoribosylanthranilate isomerase [Proteobacteria bacterium]|nr:phosphoribosylanthranilate isomerase [Pseudomonadota bacterium]MDA1132310.1 phosphoribosylanthranilate isomerase [Pseudomonadota bacterium]